MDWRVILSKLDLQVCNRERWLVVNNIPAFTVILTVLLLNKIWKLNGAKKKMLYFCINVQDKKYALQIKCAYRQWVLGETAQHIFASNSYWESWVDKCLWAFQQQSSIQKFDNLWQLNAYNNRFFCSDHHKEVSMATKRHKFQRSLPYIQHIPPFQNTV